MTAVYEPVRACRRLWQLNYSEQLSLHVADLDPFLMPAVRSTIGTQSTPTEAVTASPANPLPARDGPHGSTTTPRRTP